MYTSFGSQIALKYSRVRFVRRTRTHAANIHAASWARETADKWEWCKTMLIIASLHSHYSASKRAPPTLSYLRPRARTQNTCMYTALMYTQEYFGGCALGEYLLAKRCTCNRARPHFSIQQRVLFIYSLGCARLLLSIKAAICSLCRENY
jgi:hypothetical protein